uniref:Eukaryotic translation initiation factor 3 30 kDa subunit n=2 Tax=Kalanchoe fedtschenkoi TaxID=63787 RepID=A0A7N0VHF2_KALFE
MFVRTRTNVCHFNVFSLVEESDYKFTTALFGKKDDEKSLDTFIPKSESDFMEYAELVSHKLRPYEKSFHYLGLLKAVMRLSTANLKAADAKEVASSVTAIANEKLKAEKEANAGKKKTAAKKKQLQVDKPDDEAAGVYDALDDDYDFMPLLVFLLLLSTHSLHFLNIFLNCLHPTVMLRSLAFLSPNETDSFSSTST